MVSRTPGDGELLHHSLDAAVHSGTVDGAGVETTGYKDLQLIGIVGALVGGNATLKLQESDAVGGTYTDIPGAEITLTDTVDDSSSVFGELKTRAVGDTKRFVRAQLVVAGTSAAVGASLRLYNSRASDRYPGTTSAAGFQILR